MILFKLVVIFDNQDHDTFIFRGRLFKLFLIADLIFQLTLSEIRIKTKDQPQALFNQSSLKKINKTPFHSKINTTPHPLKTL